MPKANQAVIDCLRRIGATPADPVGLFSIAVPLVTEGFSENEIASALLWLESKNVIALEKNNRLRLLKNLPDEPH